MASIPAQEEFLAATRKGQEAMITTIKTWVETVRTTTPKLASAYAPLTDMLRKVPSVTLPSAGQLPQPEEAVASAYHLAEQLLAGQRKFAEDLLQAMVPLMPGRTAPDGTGQGTPQGHRQSEPTAPTAAAGQPRTAPATNTPKTTAATSTPKTTAVRPSPKTTAKDAPKTTAKSTPETTAKSTPKTTAKSTPRTTAARRAPKGTPAS